MDIFTHLLFVKMQCFLLQWWSVVQCWPCGKSGQEMPQLMRVVAKIAWSSHPQKMWILAQYAKIAELKINVTKCHILTSIATNVFLDEKVISTSQESPHNHPSYFCTLQLWYYSVAHYIHAGTWIVIVLFIQESCLFALHLICLTKTLICNVS